MSYLIVGIVCLVVGVIAGFLIGKKNPAVQDAAVSLSDKLK